MPGLIDINTSLQDSRKNVWEGVGQGTQAAASGGVTTLVDYAMMRTTRMNSIADLTQNIAYYTSESHIDLCLIGSLADLTEVQLEKLAQDGRLFGYWATFDNPVNNKINGLDKAELSKRIQILSSRNKNQIVFLNAHECGDRHLYQKSPFRRKDKKDRLYDHLPDSFFKVIGFGFPEDEGMGEDSSEDEDTMLKRQMQAMELKVDKVKRVEEPEKANSPLKPDKKHTFDRSAYGYEPSSAVFDKLTRKIVQSDSIAKAEKKTFDQPAFGQTLMVPDKTKKIAGHLQPKEVKQQAENFHTQIKNTEAIKEDNQEFDDNATEDSNGLPRLKALETKEDFMIDKLNKKEFKQSLNMPEEVRSATMRKSKNLNEDSSTNLLLPAEEMHGSGKSKFSKTQTQMIQSEQNSPVGAKINNYVDSNNSFVSATK